MTGDPFAIVLDLETTGLNHHTEEILELGAICVDSDLNEIDQFSSVIEFRDIEYDPTTGEYMPGFGIHDVVVKMHTKNGLWKDSYRIGVPIHDVIIAFEDWVKHLPTTEKLPLLGSTIGFDKMFLLENYWQTINSLFHYRSIDVSSIKVLTSAWKENDPPVGNKLHRSIPDCRDTINELKYYKRMLWG